MPKIDKRKASGAHYTPKSLSDFVAQNIVGTQKEIPSKIKVLDPAVGDGELLLALISQLIDKGIKEIEVTGFDTDFDAVVNAKNRITNSFPNITININHADFLDSVLNNYELNDSPSLFPTLSEDYDLIIANPPYVRTQVMGANKAQDLSKFFNLSGRVDLYFAFIKAMSKVLRPGGVAGIIVSNRFMTVKSGLEVRKCILTDFDILHIWDFGDTKLFEASVLPCVLLLKRKNGDEALKAKFTSIYSTECNDICNEYTSIFEAIQSEGNVKVNDEAYQIKQGFLDPGSDTGVWRIATEESDEWLNIVKNHTSLYFRDIGNVRVGIKTTADKVFIKKNWDSISELECPELLRPLTTHHIANRYKSYDFTQMRKVLYPHEIVDGKRIAVDLTKYPNTSAYLNLHRTQLENREYVIKSGRQWYEIWVPHDPQLWEKPKLIFRDISKEPTFWMDLSGSVVNGDCYWLTCNKDEDIDLLWLALAVGNSTFIEKYYDHVFINKLYSGRRRFISQYVEQFPLPNPKEEISQKIIQLTKSIYEKVPSQEAQALEKELDKLVYKAFGL